MSFLSSNDCSFSRPFSSPYTPHKPHQNINRISPWCAQRISPQFQISLGQSCPIIWSTQFLCINNLIPECHMQSFLVEDIFVAETHQNLSRYFSPIRVSHHTSLKLSSINSMCPLHTMPLGINQQPRPITFPKFHIQSLIKSIL